MLMKVGFCEVWGREWETEVADGEAGMRGDDWLEEGEVEQRVTDWNWNEAERMEYFGFGNEGLDIPSGFVMRH